MAGLYKYFKRQSLPKSSETGLGETVTEEANAAVQRVMEAAATNTTAGRKRKYTNFTPEQHAKIAKYAVQCGNMAATRHFSEEFLLLVKVQSESSKSST